MEKSANDSWLAKVEIKDAIDGRAQIYIDGKLVHGVIGFKVEQNAADKRVPLLTLQVQCQLDMESGAIPLLPEPWSWFYQPKVQPFVDVRDIGKPMEESEPVNYEMPPAEADRPLTQEEEDQLEKTQKLFLYGMEKNDETGAVKLIPMNGENFITIHSKEEAQFWRCPEFCVNGQMQYE